MPHNNRYGLIPNYSSKYLTNTPSTHKGILSKTLEMRFKTSHFLAHGANRYSTKVLNNNQVIFLKLM